jgi:DNA-binding GntR family transcriptional regulator
MSTQADQIHHRLRAEILTGRLIPGARIRMNDVAEEHEVSMGAVREALSRLAAEHMVIAAAQRGYTVATLSVSELTDLTNTRIAIEQLCLRGAIREGGVEWEAALLASHHRLQRLSEVELSDRSRISEDWSRAHGDFHLALVSSCRSAWLHKFRASLYLQTERYRQLSIPLRTIDRNVAGEHQALCDAALARDAAVACELMRTHLLKTTEILLDSPLLAAPLEAEERQAALLEE